MTGFGLNHLKANAAEEGSAWVQAGGTMLLAVEPGQGNRRGG
jgi:hypothetical protein